MIVPHPLNTGCHVSLDCSHLIPSLNSVLLEEGVHVPFIVTLLPHKYSEPPAQRMAGARKDSE